MLMGKSDKSHKPLAQLIVCPLIVSLPTINCNVHQWQSFWLYRPIPIHRNTSIPAKWTDCIAPPPTVKDTVMVFLVFFPAYYMLAMTSLALDANGAKTNDTKNGDTLIRMSTSCKTSTIGSENRTTKKITKAKKVNACFRIVACCCSGDNSEKSSGTSSTSYPLSL